jgi:hypothetical protein
MLVRAARLRAAWLVAASLISAALSNAAIAQIPAFPYPETTEQNRAVAATYCLPADIEGCAAYQSRQHGRLVEIWQNPFTTDADREALARLIEAAKTIAGYRWDLIPGRYFAERPFRARTQSSPAPVVAASPPPPLQLVAEASQPPVAHRETTLALATRRPGRVRRSPAARPVRVAAFFSNCSQARAAGAAPIRIGQPGYSRRLDRDGDGVACE